MSKKPRRKLPNRDQDTQKYIRSLQWDDDSRKSISDLKRLAKELEKDYGAREIESDKKKISKPEDTRSAIKWFKNEISMLLKDPASVDHKRMSKYTRNQAPISLPRPTDIGKMFFYAYDPKTKDTLPYYDIFPLILMVKGLEDGWHGLNLHYLPPKQREILITRFMENMSNTRLDKNTRMILNYNLMKDVSKYRYFKPCFKRYLVSHVKSSIKPIPFQHWPKAILLPVANFKKESITSIWADSLKKSRGV